MDRHCKSVTPEIPANAPGRHLLHSMVDQVHSRALAWSGLVWSLTQYSRGDDMALKVVTKEHIVLPNVMRRAFERCELC